MDSSVSNVAMILVAGAAATFVWRFLGVVYASRLEVGSAILDWVRAVATALIAALVVRMAVAPPGDLADAQMASRLLALAAGVGGYYLAGRAIAGGVAAAVVVFVSIESLTGNL